MKWQDPFCISILTGGFQGEFELKQKNIRYLYTEKALPGAYWWFAYCTTGLPWISNKKWSGKPSNIEYLSNFTPPNINRLGTKSISYQLFSSLHVCIHQWKIFGPQMIFRIVKIGDMFLWFCFDPTLLEKASLHETSLRQEEKRQGIIQPIPWIRSAVQYNKDSRHQKRNN